jgi:RimJ/RimL family protein N-acetyltransferase
MNIQIVFYDKVFLDLSWKWLNDPEIKALTNTPDFTKEDQKRWFDGIKSKTNYLIWGVEADKKKIGVCGLKNITAIDCEYWGYIGVKSYWGMGIGNYMMKFIENEAGERNLQSIWLQVFENNKNAIKLYDKMNYQVENQKSSMIIMRKIL